VPNIGSNSSPQLSYLTK